MSTSLDFPRSSLMAEIARAAYPDRAHRFLSWSPDELVCFETQFFSGFVASNRDMIALSFRGTNMRLDNFDNLKVSIGQWIRNLDYAQITTDSCRVHRGYYKELDGSYEELRKVLLSLRSHEQPVYVVGHSAGAAMATLMGARLTRTGTYPLVPQGVYAFSSPRVGDRVFSETYPVPLFRFERGYDIIPLLPLSPFLAKVAGSVALDRMLSALYKIFAFFGADIEPKGLLASEVEYIHAGRLYYHENDADESFYTDGTISEFVRSIAEEAFASARLPVRPVPKWMSDPLRVVALFVRASEEVSELKSEAISFVRDHHLDLISSFIGGLLKRTS